MEVLGANRNIPLFSKLCSFILSLQALFQLDRHFTPWWSYRMFVQAEAD
jgi:hypothetical protein